MAKCKCDACKKDAPELYLINPDGGYGRKEFWVCRKCIPQYARQAVVDAYPELGLPDER